MAKKVCPGCEGFLPRRCSICNECVAAIRAGRALLEKASRGSVGSRPLLWRIRPNGWPPFFHDATKGLLGRTLSRLAVEVMHPYTGPIDPWNENVIELPPGSIDFQVTYYSTYDHNAVVRSGRKAVGDLLTQVDLLIRSALVSAYESGKADGKMLLLSIARGEISVRQLNQETVDSGKAEEEEG